MLQPSELTKPIKINHTRFLNTQLLKIFFQSFQPGEDKYRLLFWTLLETGMRIKEACAIQEKDYTNNYKKLNLITCKNPKLRTVTLSPYLASFTQRWCEHNRYKFQYGYIFPTSSSNKYQHLTPNQVRGFLSKKRKQLKIEPVRVFTAKPHGYAKQTLRKRYAIECHSFRRYYETHLTDLSNGNYMLIASIMQYDDVNIVRRYYDDNNAIKAEETLSEKYHDKIVSGIIHDRPLLSRKQKTLKYWSEQKDNEEVWSMIQQKYK